MEDPRFGLRRILVKLSPGSEPRTSGSRREEILSYSLSRTFTLRPKVVKMDQSAWHSILNWLFLVKEIRFILRFPIH